MSVTHVNPEELSTPQGFAHVGVVTGTKIIQLAGQPALDRDGQLVGEGDLAAQAERAVQNVVTALAAVGATYDDVINVTIYVVDWDESKIDQLTTGFRNAAAKLGINPITPSALVGVTTLFRPGWLIELAATAVIT